MSDTNFEGKLQFARELKGSELSYLSKFLCHDRRDIGYKDKLPEGQYWYHIDFQLTEDYSGIEWNGAEKSYDLHHILNFLTDRMREQYPDFDLVGELRFQGPNWDDRGWIRKKDGLWVEEKQVVVGTLITCPACENKFILSEENSEECN